MYRTATTVAAAFALISTGLVGMFLPTQTLPPTIDGAYAAPVGQIAVRHARNFTPVVTSDGKVRAIAYGDLDLAASRLSPAVSAADGKPMALAQQTYDPSSTLADSAAALAVAAPTGAIAPARAQAAGLGTTGLAWGLMIVGLGLVGVAVRARRQGLVVVA